MEILRSPSCACSKLRICRESPDILAPLPYRRRHDHDSVHRPFHPRLQVSSPHLPAAAAPRSATALLRGPTSLGLALPGLAAGPQRRGVGNPQPGPVGIAKAFGAITAIDLEVNLRFDDRFPPQAPASAPPPPRTNVRPPR